MKKLYARIFKWLKIGKCVHCGKYTRQQKLFADEPEPTSGYPDYCHEECFEILLGKL